MTTICPHCQTPLDTSDDGETRCPQCGFMVLPQAGRICPNCHKYTLASLEHCQHCHAPMPPAEPDSQRTAPFSGRAKPDWVRTMRALIVMVFSVLCAFGLYNYVQDKQQNQKALREHEQVKAFAYHYATFQKQFMQRFSRLLDPRESRRPLSAGQILTLKLELQKTYIPQCRQLILELDSLPLPARQQIVNPEGIRKTLLEQIELMNLMHDSLRQTDSRALQTDPAQPQIKI